MIKAYFFDFTETLAKMKGEVNTLSNLISTKELEFILKQDIKKFQSPKKQRIINKIYSEDISLYPESTTVIETLKEEGYRLGIISNVDSITKEFIKNGYTKFLKNFDVITWSSEIGVAKPDPDAFKFTLFKLNKDYNLNIKSDEVMMIGNNVQRDLVPALNLGMRARLLDRNKQSLYDIIGEEVA